MHCRIWLRRFEILKSKNREILHSALSTWAGDYGGWFSARSAENFSNCFNDFFKKKARAARKFQKFRGICTFHVPLGACATCLAGDPEIVKLCTLLQWIWFFAVILDKMQVWGSKKDASCTWCFWASCTSILRLGTIGSLVCFRREPKIDVDSLFKP